MLYMVSELWEPAAIVAVFVATWSWWGGVTMAYALSWMIVCFTVTVEICIPNSVLWKQEWWDMEMASISRQRLVNMLPRQSKDSRQKTTPKQSLGNFSLNTSLSTSVRDMRYACSFLNSVRLRYCGFWLANDRPYLSSEREPHKDAIVTVRQLEYLVMRTRSGSIPTHTDWLTDWLTDRQS
jgi:hypothetical protein